MRTFVKHAKDGEIMSIVQIDSLPEGFEPWGILEEGEQVTEIELPARLEAMELHDLHDGYRLDMAKGKLVKKRAPRSSDTASKP